VHTWIAFEWDTGKDATDIAKPEIDLEDALRIFNGLVVESLDEHRR
jgi:uncharacterized DUF497 family protein